MAKESKSLTIRKSGGELLPDNKTHTNRIQIPSESSDRLYIVSQAKKSGEWQCDCPGWTMNRHRTSDGKCKHLRTMMPLLTNMARKQVR